jgi:nicotinamide-nucleotide amidase
MIDQKLLNLATQIKQQCVARKITVSTVESCTGGMLSSYLTAVSGSSKYFGFGFITYSNQAKSEMLGISLQAINKFGAVSEEIVSEMALHSRFKAATDISIAISGIAGPTGGSETKPVGTVCFGVVSKKYTETYTFHFVGNREEIRRKSCEKAMELLLSSLSW